MEINKNRAIRSFLLFIGLIILVWSLLSFGSLIISSIESIFNLNNFVFSLDYSLFINFVIFFFIGIICLYIGIFWDNVFKQFTKISISIAIFMLTISIFLYALNSNTSQIKNSIQPSIDYLVAYSLDDLLNSEIKDISNDTTKLSLLKNKKIEKFYVSNITLNQVNIIADRFNFKNHTNQDKITFSKIFISLIYDNILKNEPKLINTSLELSFLINLMRQQGLDINIFENLEISELELLYPQNNNAYLNIIIFDKEELKTVKINNLTDSEVDLIWENLGFNETLSKNSKNKIITTILSFANKEKQFFGNAPIPTSSISSFIPEDFKIILNYDIFSENISKRAENIVQIRSLCLNQTIKIDEVCSMIIMTNYDILMNNLKNLSSNNLLSINFTSILSNYDTLEKVDESITNKSNKWHFFLFFYIFLILISLGLYYLHFKIFNKELIKVHIPYFIAKHNLINFILSFLIFVIIYYLMVSGRLIDFILNRISGNNLSFIKNLPILNVIEHIFDEIIYFSIIYLLISIFVYIGLYFILKKDVESFKYKY